MTYEPDPTIYEPAVETWGDRWHPRVTVSHGHPQVFQSMNFGQSPDHTVVVNRRLEEGERKARTYNKGTEQERRVIEMSVEEAAEVCTDMAEGIIADMIEDGPQEFEIIVTEMVARKVKVRAFSRYEASAIALCMIEDGALPGAVNAEIGDVVSRRAQHAGARPTEVDGDKWKFVEAADAEDWTFLQGEVEA